VDKIRHDARTYQGYAMNKPAYEILQLIENARPLIKDIKVPFLAYHGEKDIVTFPSSSKLLYNQASTPGMLKSLKIIPNCKHQTIHELDPISSPILEEFVHLSFYENFSKKPVVDVESIRAPSTTK